MEKNNLMDVQDVAIYLKLQKQTIYNWLNNGKLAGIKVGRVWRFRKSDIDKWLGLEEKDETKTQIEREEETRS